MAFMVFNSLSFSSFSVFWMYLSINLSTVGTSYLDRKIGRFNYSLHSDLIFNRILFCFPFGFKFTFSTAKTNIPGLGFLK